ncbi:EcoAI/FtnUII family type I restriction enzme subunit R [Campylobacter concisus]|uniref:EcoAI/FtnUII family type I restriction enzme subunit R n=1 Tax=Campylobacter concisus TaxID=199 RepID=UPI0011E6C5EC|nr:DEAD/DEAH box helicase family protein [Campylobacter concisus]
MTEEDVKLKFITPAIEQAGWDKISQISMEYQITDGRINLINNVAKRDKVGIKKADYVLSYQLNLPLAIVEAKDDSHGVRHGLEQAKMYAQMLDAPFAYSSNGSGFVEFDFLSGSQRELALNEFPTPYELWQRFLEYKHFSSRAFKIIQEPYFYDHNAKKPRYYQQVAINRAIEAVANGKKRLMLVMATGTGKTYVAFQIIHRLYRAGAKKKILFLADRNILVDQSEAGDFKPFGNKMTKIKDKLLDSSYEIYLSLYQQLVDEDGNEPFREFSPDFFDLIIIDECHRGSAKDDSQWRKILDYFKSATHIGLTATPKEDNEISNSLYFGEPIYTYSLKQGINDGFLAPFKVIRVGIDVDLMEYRPPEGMLDDYGNEIPDKIYNIKDYDRNLVLTNRTKLVASRISEFLKSTDRMAKTIVFCVDIEHAQRMCEALRNENSDLVRQNPSYIAQITGDVPNVNAMVERFSRPDEIYPVIAVTSKLLTTGVDCKTCKVIAIDSCINSITEFKQIIGRGTRLREDFGKTHFTILDFRGVSRLFADPKFDGEPIKEDDLPAKEKFIEEKPPKPKEDKEKSGERKIVINGTEVKILDELEQIYDQNGNLIASDFKDFSRQNILAKFKSLENFITSWDAQSKKQAIINELKDHGALLDELKIKPEFANLDEFDLICHIAYNKPPCTRKERADGVKKRDFLSKYSDKARGVLLKLIDKYADNGISDLENINVLKNDPFRDMGGMLEIVNDFFGGKEKYFEAIKELEKEIYAA